MSEMNHEPVMPPEPAPVQPEAPVAAPSPMAAPVASAPATSRRGPGVFAIIMIAAVTSLVVGIFAGLGGYLMGQGIDSSSNAVVTIPQVSEGSGSATTPGASIASIAAAELPSVVSIVATGANSAGSGSGFVIRSDGYILTNNHVVAIAKGGKLEVVFNDGTRIKGEVVGTNPEYDIAVVKVA